MLCLSSLRYPWVSPASHVHLLLAIQTSRILWPLVRVPSSPRVVTVTKPLTMWVYTSLTREDQTLNLYAVKQVTGAWLWTTMHVNKTSIAHNQSPTCQICIPIFFKVRWWQGSLYECLQFSLSSCGQVYRQNSEYVLTAPADAPTPNSAHT